MLIAGAGVGGLEAALALHDLAGDRVAVELHDPRREFAFRPFSVGGPYGAGARAFHYDMAALCAQCGARFDPSAIASVDPERRLAVTRDGEAVRYDHLLIAVGVRMLWSVPGAITFWGAADEGQVGEAMMALRAGELRRLVLTMPDGRNWTLPLYELALLAATEAERVGTGEARIAIVTPEEKPLEAFGRRVVEGISDLLAERGIEVICGSRPVKFEHERLLVEPEGEIEADAVVSLPRLEGRRVGGVPHDADGFVDVDEHCRVIGLDGIHALGDVTAFPVKQGDIACWQGDATGEAVAAAAGAAIEARPFDPVLRGVIWTGREPRYLYGRSADGLGEASGFSDHPEGAMSSERILARYLTPLVDRLSAETDPGEGADSTAAARMPPSR